MVCHASALPPTPRAFGNMAGSRVNAVLDVLHKGTVGVLVVSTVYFSVEIVRATWHLQKTKFERQRQMMEDAKAAHQS